MSDYSPMPTEPENIPAALMERFNSGQADAMMGLYEEGAVFVTNSGVAVSDPADIRRELESFLALRLPMKAHARHLIVSGDIALILLDWELEGTGPNGQHVHLKGSATDIAHRGVDGRWRYRIDNPYGTRFREQY
ncbi:nuclear transport factor 2 family protein [Streptomyces sp. NL15-2K]|uniref:YybH family protein n=1 Tax=Streptomyces sp. NL15-2K TaxID=376149 RepID=UPI000F58933F|nr:MULTISPECIES: nuclear transport factor 2 family protein [Actinomycetes]WKX14276.1 nuclear transport factor 2 family protein [Kutzneria buriramensis]GCB53386.1 ketosteroid isomerase-like protein [Streptomyces sp. NL15-2K]